MPNVNSGSGEEEDKNLSKYKKYLCNKERNMCRGDSFYSVMTYEDVVGMYDFPCL